MRSAEKNTQLFESFHQFNTDGRNSEPDHIQGTYDDIIRSLEHDAEFSGAKQGHQDIANTQETATHANGGTDIDDNDKVIDLLSTSPLLIDELIRTSKLSANRVSTILIELELAGRVERHPGNRVSRIAK